MWDLKKITITHEILNMISKLDEFKGSWHFTTKLSPERLNILKKVATIESIGSSTRIEGSQLSDKEVEKLICNIKSSSFKSRDEQEVAGYSLVCSEIFQSFLEIPITESIIKQLHGWLLKYSNKDERHRGKYKTLANNVEAFSSEGKSLGIIFETTSPFDTPFEMKKLIKILEDNFEDPEIHPLITIGVFVVFFLAIHPFQDGNGRLSRVITNLLLLQKGYSYVPYSSLESIIEKNKEGYYLSLMKTQKSLKAEEPNFSEWLTFFFKALIKQKEHLEIKLKKENLIKSDNTATEREILFLLKDHQIMSINQIHLSTNINKNTLKKYLSKMVDQNKIKMVGKNKSTKYEMI